MSSAGFLDTSLSVGHMHQKFNGLLKNLMHWTVYHWLHSFIENWTNVSKLLFDWN